MLAWEGHIGQQIMFAGIHHPSGPPAWANGGPPDRPCAVGLAERHVSRQLPLTYLEPDVLKRLVYKCDVVAVTDINLSNCATLPCTEQAKVAFNDAEQGDA